MLSKVSEQIADCLKRADEARQRASREANEKFKAEWLEMEKRWLRSAKSLRFVDRANRYLDDTVRVTASNNKSQSCETS